LSAEEITKIRNVFDLIRAGLNQEHYHRIMNYLYEKAYGSHYMVHFPYHQREGETLIQGQINLTEVCLDVLPRIEGSTMIEVGCGNGVQSIYVKEHRTPALMIGLDINEDNVELARYLAGAAKLEGIEFICSDAQDMQGVEDASCDYLMNVESGFHYPEKDRFFAEIHRVLKPGGMYVIADIVAREDTRNFLLNRWERRLNQHYWPLPRYLASLEAAGLTVDVNRDITDSMIAGFEDNRSWFDVGSRKGRRAALFALAIFARIQISRHRYYLRNHCQYVLLSGKKAG